jgi:hypothetical protein
MLRVKLDAPTSGVTVSAAATLGVCLTDELAVLVGTSVPRYRCGSELREALKLWAQKPRDPVTVAVGSVRSFLGSPSLTADQLEATAATALNAVVPDETQVGVVLGANAAALLDRSNLLLAAVRQAIDQFVATFGV